MERRLIFWIIEAKLRLASKGDFESFDLLFLKNNMCDINAFNIDKLSPLIIAIKSERDYKIIDKLLEKGAKVDMCDN